MHSHFWRCVHLKLTGEHGHWLSSARRPRALAACAALRRARGSQRSSEGSRRAGCMCGTKKVRARQHIYVHYTVTIVVLIRVCVLIMVSNSTWFTVQASLFTAPAPAPAPAPELSQAFERALTHLTIHACATTNRDLVGVFD